MTKLDGTYLSKKMAGILVLAVALTGCWKASDKSVSEVDQSKICIANSDTEAKKCTPGQLFYLQPQSWGNEQLPLNITAAYCDFNHPVVYNNAGVICVFTDKRLHLMN
ncbi:hypothetical protein [Pseudomonas luteola]|uniref:hypothetical protein n=1 Tax=Pseudomonas TaxID=286 RepID=UPI003DA086EA